MSALHEAVENYFYDVVSSTWVKGASDAGGNLLVSIGPINRTPLTFENTITTGAPVVLDINTAYGENGREFSIVNDGNGDFTVAISGDGSVYGGEHTVKNGEVYAIDNISIDSIRITWVADSSYRVVAL